MKETIEFKKEIILKTAISEMVEINLTHEYKVMDDVIEGDFYVTGEYKMTEASVKLEEFYYKIPFAIALSDRIKRESINLIIENFDYEIHKDVLMLKMNLGMNYEEEEVKEEVKFRNEEMLENIIDEEVLQMEEELDVKEEIKEEEIKEEIKEELEDEEKKKKEQEEIKVEIDNIAQKFNMPDDYMTYKIHIVKESESLESVAMKYEVSLDSIKEYNEMDTLSIGDKVLVPLIKNE